MANRLLLLLALFVALDSCSPWQAGDGGGVPPKLWMGDTHDWNPPTGSLPAEYVKASQELLKEGFGDPRRGEYREIFSGLVVNRSQSPREFETLPEKVLQATRGWYFPAKDGQPERAVLLNGITCKPAKVGPPIDLDAEIKRALVSRQSRVYDEKFWLGEYYEPEAVLELCVVGRIDDAKKLSNMETTTWKPLDGLTTRQNVRQTLGFYAYNSYAQGDDDLAYEACTLQQSLTKDEPQDKWTAREIAANDKIISDLVRRLAPRTVAPMTLSVQASRIQKEIGELDEVAAQWVGFHAQTREYLIYDPRVQVLVKEGPAAVEPLLTCIRNDDRLTRSNQEGSYVPVKTAAIAALSGILKFDNIVPGCDPYGYSAPNYKDPNLVPWLSKLWQRVGSMPLTDRYYSILADDEATPLMWHEAAVRLLCPEDVALSSTVYPVGPDLTDFFRKVPVKGAWEYMNREPQGSFDEPLSADVAKLQAMNPPVSELVARRIKEILKQPVSHFMDGPSCLYMAMQMSRYLADMDAKVGMPLLNETNRQCQELIASLKPNYISGLGSEPVWNNELRMRLGNASSSADYVQMVLQQSHKQPDDREEEWLMPLIKNQSDPKNAAVLDKVFNDRASLWNPSRQDTGELDITLSQTRLLALAAYRKSFVHILDNKKEVGTASYNGRQVTISLANGSEGVMPQGSDVPKVGEVRSVRFCDVIAERLAFMVRTPLPFQSYWPLPMKDAAIAKLKDLVNHHPDQIRLAKKTPYGWTLDN